MQKTVVLAYSGGLDTSVAISWLKEKYGYEVVVLSLDLGESRDPEGLRSKALSIGAKAAYVEDAKDLFAGEYLTWAIYANALYQKEYPLATALSRPLMARRLVEVAREVGASAVAHGCTGKGNDQVRFDVAVSSLAPDLDVVAPVREWAWSRLEEMAYAREHGIPVPTTVESPYSVDANLWGRSVEGGVLEDPWQEPPEECYAWTVPPEAAPVAGAEVTITFEAGLPVALDGVRHPLVPLIEQVSALAGAHGIGRLDLIEDRLIGIKSREVYEAPGATVLIAAHRAMEAMTLPKDLLQHKSGLEETFGQLVYNGLWTSPLADAIRAYLRASQESVTGDVRLRLRAGSVKVVGRRSPLALYRPELATYGEGDAFDVKAATGFIAIWSLPLKAGAMVHAR